MDHPHHVGPYAIQRLLGEGGSAWVYQAYDPRLERRVALKVLKLPTPEWVARLRHEALVQARLHHPHLVPIYEVGEADGRVYLAMQFVQGSTLRQAAEVWDLDTTLRVMVKVADAVHSAHRQGLIHRDLKPANILVSLDVAGQPWPYVVDFGLARLWEGQSLTAPGQMVGSPAYMAPEQVQGGEVDPRTDVYGLGATLYELIAGRTPFEGQDAVSILMQVVRDTPPRLGAFVGGDRPPVPWGLEAAVSACLAKDPASRYPSAALLRDDLQRLLDGEPVLARRESAWRRTRTWVRAHRALAAVSGIALVLVAGLGAGLVATRLRASREARLALDLARETALSQAGLERAYLLPTHDVGPERLQARRSLEVLEGRDLLGGIPFRSLRAQSTGMGYLSQEDPARARPRLEQAWALGRRGPELSLALGLTYAALYREALPGLDPRSAQAKAELEKTLRDPAVTHLRLAQQAPGPWPPAYLEAVLAACEARWDEALAQAAIALQRDGTFFRAHQLVGEVHLQRALERLRGGKFPEAHADITAAEAAFRQVLAVARSYPGAHAGLASCWLRRADILVNAGTGDPEALEAPGLAAFQAALDVDSSAAAPRAGRARFRIQLANRLSLQGRDPFPHMEAACADARTALELDGEAPAIVGAAVYSHMMLGAARFDWGQDPRAAFGEAIRLGEAFLGSRTDDTIMRGLNICYTGTALYAARCGRDANPAFAKARDHGRSVVERYPRAATYRALGEALHHWAETRFADGGDPTDLLAESETALLKGLEANPKSVGIRTVLADVWLLRGQQLHRQGKDPTPAFAASRARVDEALALDSASGEALAVAFGLALARAEADPGGPALKEAERLALDRTRTQPSFPGAWRALARVRERQAVGGGLPRLLDAARCREKAVALSHGDPRNLLELSRLLDRILTAKGGPTRAPETRQRILELVARLLILNPDHAEALALKRRLS